MKRLLFRLGYLLVLQQLFETALAPVFAYVAIGLLALVLGGGIVFWFTSDTSRNEVKVNNSSVPLPNSSNTQTDSIRRTQTNQNEQPRKVSDDNPQVKTGSGKDNIYSNPRFGYSISYPPDILQPQPVAENGDGREFRSADRQTKMLVYGTENVDGQTLAQKYNDEINQAGRTVTYKVLRSGFFAVSGYDGASIFYRKTLFKNNQFMTFSITYPTAQRGIYDSITVRASKSFR